MGKQTDTHLNKKQENDFMVTFLNGAKQ